MAFCVLGIPYINILNVYTYFEINYMVLSVSFGFTVEQTLNHPGLQKTLISD